jgi:hyperosmotically inducible protein
MKVTMYSLGMALSLTGATAMVSLCGCAGNRYEQSTGEHIDDKATSMRVKRALEDDSQYRYPDVQVQTFKGTTQLSGFVNTGDQKSRAAEIAKNVEGVKDVENNISVKE